MSDQGIDYDFPQDRTMRKTRLVVCGILLALMGVMVGMLSAFYFLMPKLMGGQPGMEQMNGMQPMLFSAGFLYGSIGLIFLILGVGSIFLKRWSRPLVLVLCWWWLYSGIVGLIAMVFQFSKMREQMIDQMAAQGQEIASVAGPAMVVGMGIGMVFFFVFGVILPGLLVWLYSNCDVKATVEFCDRKHRWTDRCPTPVLGISVTCVVSTMMMAFSVYWMRLVPVFGKVYEGQTAVLIMAGMGVFFLLVAWGAYRQQILAWLALAVFMVVASVSAFMTFPKFDWGIYYQKMGFPEEQIEPMVAMVNEIYGGNTMIIMGIIGGLPILIYLIWVLRFFLKKDEGMLIAGEQ